MPKRGYEPAEGWRPKAVQLSSSTGSATDRLPRASAMIIEKLFRASTTNRFGETPYIFKGSVRAQQHQNAHHTAGAANCLVVLPQKFKDGYTSD